VITAKENEIWSNHTNRNNGARLKVKDGGNLAIQFF